MISSLISQQGLYCILEVLPDNSTSWEATLYRQHSIARVSDQYDDRLLCPSSPWSTSCVVTSCIGHCDSLQLVKILTRVFGQCCDWGGGVHFWEDGDRSSDLRCMVKTRCVMDGIYTGRHAAGWGSVCLHSMTPSLLFSLSHSGSRN